MARAQKQMTQEASPRPAAKASRAATVTQLRSGPTHDQISRRAYELYVERGYVHGHEQEDWAQAERELQLGRY